MNACRYLSILWSKTHNICEHKALLMIVSCSLQFFDFIQALSKQFNRNWVYFMFYSQVKLFLWCSTGTGSEMWPIKIFSFSFEWMMIYIVIEYIIDYFILIQTPFQVFESTTVCVIRKYKFDDIACSDVLFSCIDITTSSWD